MIDDLEPHEHYEVSLQSINQYTVHSTPDISQQFLLWFEFQTSPGGKTCATCQAAVIHIYDMCAAVQHM